MVIAPKWIYGNLQECEAKVLKIRLLQKLLTLTFVPRLIHDYTFLKVEFKAIYLKQVSAVFLHKNVVIYELDTWSRDLNTNLIWSCEAN